MADNHVHQPPPALIDAVQELIEFATERLTNDDETFIECKLCGGLDGHDGSCPIPACQKWMSES
jgi:hypothetical protein